MNFLAIDTSHHHCSVSVHIDGDTKNFHQHMPRQQSAELLGAIKSVLADAGLTVRTAGDKFNFVAVGQGPGSFVGLRLAISVAQGLAEAWGLPVVAVPTLPLLATQAISSTIDDSDQSSSGLCWVAADARMGQVYTALYHYQWSLAADKTSSVTLESIVEATTLTPTTEKLALFLQSVLSNKVESQKLLLIGTGFSEYSDAFATISEQVVKLERVEDDIPRASEMGQYCQQVLSFNDLAIMHDHLSAALGKVTVPEYVRDDVAAKASR